MLRFLRKLIVYHFFIFCLVLKAQIKEDTFSRPSESLKTEYREKKRIEEAYNLLKNNKEKEAYIIAHELLKKTLDNRSKTNVNLLLGYYFNSRQINDSSLFYTKKALKYNKLIKNDSLKNRTYSLGYNLFGINNKRIGLLEESRKWHRKGIDISQKFKEKNLYYTHTHGLALVYSEMGDYKSALNLFKECLTYKDNPTITYGSYINIGSIYAKLNDYKSSNDYYQKALKLSQQKENYHAIAVIKINLAINYQDQKDVDKATTLYNEVILLSEEKEYKHLSLIARLNKGSVYKDLKKYNDAEIAFYSALHDAIELGYLDDQKLIYDNLKDIFIAQNDYKKAFEFVTKSFEIKDSINKLQSDKEIDELEVKYKTLQKEKEIKVLQVENYNRKLELKNQDEAIKNLKLQQEVQKKENENKILSFQNASEKKLNEITLLKKDQEIQETKLIRQKGIKNTILYSFLILLVPVIGLLVTYYQKLQTQSELNKKQEEISGQKISSLLKDQELKLIKASIEGQDKERKRIAQELHDSIGGNLAAIKLQLNNPTNSNKEDYLKTINYQIDDTYEQVRSLSHNLIPKKFSKNNFCDVLEEYFSNIGKSSSLTTSFVVYPRIEIDFLEEILQIEAFKIIQELITNTIKHSKASSVELQLNLVDNVLSILFEDNGIGFNPNNNNDGIGFENIKSRLNKIYGTFHIDSRINRGTIINIEIPTLTTIANEI
ncbi:tetratricopeptide repeat-containing sensor histidine kinase [Aquimarina algiphila]|uniref:histidine kinase n=1 Tax=Aquimarina algiphila TaxID=2047982 RepID=A0A554VDU8_9FLAO|nr:tetratricopeptide repeat protein [Aquimarina algiphila]TSE05106.1 tetratricopeptide repeat protein [Aquimarina algiphila]